VYDIVGTSIITACQAIDRNLLRGSPSSTNP
jgi:hypothetical protein